MLYLLELSVIEENPSGRSKLETSVELGRTETSYQLVIGDGGGGFSDL